MMCCRAHNNISREVTTSFEHRKCFKKNHLLTFKGRYDPEGAQIWIYAIEKIYWWECARQRLEALGTEITWEVFKHEFLEKYSPADIRNKKEIEFLKLK